MTDYASISEQDLAPPPDSGTAAPASGTYSTVSEDDLAQKPKGGFYSNFRGPRGGMPNIPAAAAERFRGSDAVAGVFTGAAKGFANGFATSYTQLAAKDQQDINDFVSQPGPGKTLRWAGSVLAGGADIIADGFLALGGGVSGAFGGAEGGYAKATGEAPDVVASAEREGGFIGQAIQSDIGTMHGNALEGARAEAAAAEFARQQRIARVSGGEELPPPPGGPAGQTAVDGAPAQAVVPGIYSQASRVDQTPGGGLVHTPLGRLPNEAEAVGQSQVVATALGLPDSAANIIHRTYVETGRPPAEVLMDARTNAGGVLSDIVSGKVPEAYKGPGRPMTPEELAAARPAGEVSPSAPASPETAGTSSAPTGQETAPIAPAAPAPVAPSKIGQSIAQKAIDQGLTNGFLETAGYEVKTVEGQKNMVANLVANSPDKMNAIVNGEQALPHGMDPSMFIAGVESYIEQTKDWDLAYRLANSPVVTKTSEAAQTLRFAQERTPDSATAKLQEILAAQEKQAGGKAAVAKRQTAVKSARGELDKVLLPKEEQSWTAS